MSAGAGAGIVAEVAHAGALPDRPVGQSDPEQLHASVRASPRVVAIVAAMRTPPSHRACWVAIRIGSESGRWFRRDFGFSLAFCVEETMGRERRERQPALYPYMPCRG